MKKKSIGKSARKGAAKKAVRLSRPLVSERTEALVESVRESGKRTGKTPMEQMLERAALREKREKALRARDKLLAELGKDRQELRAEQEGEKWTFARMAEGAFHRNFTELMARFNIPLQEGDILVQVRKDNHYCEYDIVGINSDTTVITEVKSRFTAEHVTELYGKLARFRLEHPELVRGRVVGVVAGLSVNADAADLARKFGFIVLKLNGAAISSQTPADFAPAFY